MDLQAQAGIFENVTTRREVGYGKQNTQRLVTELNKKNQKGKAAQICVDYTLNGYKDWFLPSRDELNLLYVMLRQRNLTSFQGVDYCSSTIQPKTDFYREYYQKKIGRNKYANDWRNISVNFSSVEGQNFNTGNQWSSGLDGSIRKSTDNYYFFRPIRYF